MLPAAEEMLYSERVRPMAWASGAKPRVSDRYKGIPLVKLMNAMARRIPAPASTPTGPASRDRSNGFSLCPGTTVVVCWRGINTSMAIPIATPTKEISVTYCVPNDLTTASIATGITAAPNEPPAAHTLMLTLSGAPVLRAMAAAPGWKTAEPSPPTAKMKNSDHTLGATDTKPMSVEPTISASEAVLRRPHLSTKPPKNGCKTLEESEMTATITAITASPSPKRAWMVGRNT